MEADVVLFCHQYMTTPENYLRCFFRFLAEESVDYCVLRNYEHLPESMGKDLDILARSRDVWRIRAGALHCASEAGYLLESEIPFSPRSLYFGHSSNRLLQIDIYTDLTWRGVKLLDTDLVLRSATEHNGLRVADPVQSAYLNLVRRLLLHSELGEKYGPSIRQMALEREDEFIDLLSRYLSSTLARQVVRGAQTGDWNGLLRQRRRIAGEYLLSAVRGDPLRLATNGAIYLIRSTTRQFHRGRNSSAVEPRFSLNRVGSAGQGLAGLGAAITVAWLAWTAVSLSEAGVHVVLVPEEAKSIQAAIDMAADGDTVLVRPGIYRENLVLDGKTITLASYFQETGDRNVITETVIDGSGRSAAVEIGGNVGPRTTIVGFTITNALDGIHTNAVFQLLYSRITDAGDGVDYAKGGGGAVRFSVLEGNKDDGLDLDWVASAMVLEGNVIQDNGDDGVEIRLNPYRGSMEEIKLNGNLIARNREHGVQITGKRIESSRVLRLERNLFIANGDAGVHMRAGAAKDIGTVAGGDRGLSESVYLINNTFVENETGLVGGNDVRAHNNIVVASRVGFLEVDDESLVTHTLFWNNLVNAFDSNLDTDTTWIADPKLHERYSLSDDSPAIDAGLRIGLPFKGAAPDLGASELDSGKESRFGEG